MRACLRTHRGAAARGRRNSRLEFERAMAHVVRKDPLTIRPFVSLGSSRFGPVYRRGRRAEVDGVLVITAPGESGPPQVGIVAGRTVGNAVRRNRAKRRLREAMRQVELRPDMAYVVVASPEMVAAPFGEVKDRLRAAIAESEETRR